LLFFRQNACPEKQITVQIKKYYRKREREKIRELAHTGKNLTVRAFLKVIDKLTGFFPGIP
jgi:hypothetical protein